MKRMFPLHEMRKTHRPYIYCGGCRKEHVLSKVEAIEVLPYNDRTDQLVYWCDKMQDVYISMIFEKY